MTIYDIIDELNQENGSNYKMDVLRKHSDNELLKRVLKMTYDRATYTYGITLKNVDHPGFEREASFKRTLTEVLDYLEENYVTRKVTGNTALDIMSELLYSLDIPDRHILHGVVNRDLRINMGRSNINKVFKGLIVKPVYMRCGIYNEKTAKKIDPKGAFVQLKADGTYREFTLENGKVACISRSGEEYDYSEVTEALLDRGQDGVYHGELTVYDEDGVLLDRSTGNGIINSGDFTGYFLKLDVWDFISLEEYSNAANKIKGTTPYHERLGELSGMFPRQDGGYIIETIETHVINTIGEALSHVNRWMSAGLEGGILKDRNMIFRDGTNPQQLKLKLEIDAEVRITGFTEGTPGTKREKTFGAITFETDDGQVKGQTSGFTDKQLEDFNSRREELIGTIMTVQFNDVTKGRNNDYFALSHPRFIELRPDKTETDTIERIEELKQMAMELS